MNKVQFLCSPPSFVDGYKNMTETTDICKHHKKHYTSVYDQHFYGGRRVVDGEGVAVKVGKGESCSEGFRRCHHPCPLENFNHTITILIFS